jgi:protein-tyrosine phosphatase
VRGPARVPLPRGVPGALYASGMPGSSAGTPFLMLASELRSHSITQVVCLASEEELLDRSPEYYGALLRGEVDVPVERFFVPDWGVPEDAPAFLGLARSTAARLRAGERVLVHCAGGCGRTGMFCACVLVALGATPDEAVAGFRAARGCGPETESQMALVTRAAVAL